jgi:hypothetical protein
MANALYNTFKNGLGLKVFDMDADVFKATLADAADYTFDTAHDFYGGASPDVAAAAKVAVSADIAGTWSAAGVFDSGDFTWTAVTGDQCEQVLLWDDTITDDRLCAFYDTGMTGMPVTPNGGDINFTVHASGWFAL